MSHFKLLDLPETFDIDLTNLEDQYFKLQSLYHPDHARGDQQKQEFLQKSMDINAAYECLKDNLNRAEHLLELSGVLVNQEVGGVKPSQAILIEALEAREELESVNDTEELKMLFVKYAAKNKGLVIQISNAFKDKDFQLAASLATNLKYMQKLLSDIRSKIKNI